MYRQGRGTGIGIAGSWHKFLLKVSALESQKFAKAFTKPLSLSMSCALRMAARTVRLCA